MSGIVELAYTVLLGWMRAVFDWFWSIASGNGNGGVFQWFLSNWKMWLIVLLVIGLVVDWLTWVMRWRPYRVLFSRFRRAPAKSAEEQAENWDDGIGYYEPEIAVDSTPDWADTTFATLSEIDPDWAGDIVIDEEPPPQYATDYQTPASRINFYADEDEYAFAEAPEDSFGDTKMIPTEGYWDDIPEEPVPVPPAEEYDYEEPPSAFDPYAPYDAYAPEDIEDVPPVDELPPFYEDEEYPEDAEFPPSPEEDMYYEEDTEEPPAPAAQYGRPSLWPGEMFPMAEEEEPVQEEEPAPVAQIIEEEAPPPAEPYDPLFNPDAPPPEESATPRRRRRRRLREITPEAWQPEDPIPQAEEPEPFYEEPPEPEAYSSEPVPLPTWLDAPESYEPEEYPGRPAAPYAPPAPQGDRIVAYIGPDDEPESEEEELPPPPAEPNRRPARPAKAASPTAGGDDKDKRKGIRTVTGKPALRKGLMRLTSAQDEAISGLPPLQLTDPFLPPVLPDNVDFAEDEGEEYDD